jgi:hypothetical protein
MDAKSFAMNWEGHDAWFHDTTPFREFYEGIPPPLTKPKPACATLRAKHAGNPYEQTAIPGKNCREEAKG